MARRPHHFLVLLCSSDQNMSSVCVQAVAGAITCAANAYFLFLYTTGRRNDDRDFQIVGAHAAAAHATIMTQTAQEYRMVSLLDMLSSVCSKGVCPLSCKQRRCSCRRCLCVWLFRMQSEHPWLFRMQSEHAQPCTAPCTHQAALVHNSTAMKKTHLRTAGSQQPHVF